MVENGHTDTDNNRYHGIPDTPNDHSANTGRHRTDTSDRKHSPATGTHPHRPRTGRTVKHPAHPITIDSIGTIPMNAVEEQEAITALAALIAHHHTPDPEPSREHTG